jgi:hypothetical protein
MNKQTVTGTLTIFEWMLPLACLAVSEGWTVPPLWEEETP